MPHRRPRRRLRWSRWLRPSDHHAAPELLEGLGALVVATGAVLAVVAALRLLGAVGGAIVGVGR